MNIVVSNTMRRVMRENRSSCEMKKYVFEWCVERSYRRKVYRKVFRTNVEKYNDVDRNT